MSQPIRALELYCGIGGFAAAAEPLGVEVVGAIDISPHVVQIYNHNWTPVARQQDLLSLGAEDLASFEADLWWMSPPCAPYTRRGNALDIEDHRAASFLHVLSILREVRPGAVALENVAPFASSRARELLLDALTGYHVVESVLCPTELGVPNKRPRYYLVASKSPFSFPSDAASPTKKNWRAYIDENVSEEYRVPDAIVKKYGAGFHVMNPDENYTTCFTGSYGKSWNFTGSYMPLDEGGLRLFTPTEVLRFLGFPETFVFPEPHHRRQQWKYAGNSLSVPAVSAVLNKIRRS